MLAQGYQIRSLFVRLRSIHGNSIFQSSLMYTHIPSIYNDDVKHVILTHTCFEKVQVAADLQDYEEMTRDD